MGRSVIPSRVHLKDYLIVTAAVVFALVVGGLGLSWGANTILPGPDSREALLATPGEQIAFERGIPPKDSLAVVLTHHTHLVTSERFIAARDSMVTLLKKLGASESKVTFTDIKTAGHSLLGDEHFQSKDLRSVLITAQTKSSVTDSAESESEIPIRIAEWKKLFPDFEVSYLSKGTVSNELFDLIHHDLDRSLIFTIPITILILLWTFRSLSASLVTVSISCITLIASLGVAVFISRSLEPISATASQLVVLLVMAIGTDYSLFFISRVRQEFASGKNYLESIRATQATTGVAIFWSGITVATSLIGLFFMRDTVLTSMALVSVTSVGITLGFTLVILPALLRILGGHIEAGAVRGATSKNNAQLARLIAWTNRNPKTIFLSSGLFLLVLAAFCWQMKLGSTVQLHLLPSGMQSVSAFHHLEETFSEIAGTELSVIVHADGLSEKESDGELDTFFDSVQSNDRLRGPLQIDRSADLTTFRYVYSVQGDSNDEVNRSMVDDINLRHIPKLFAEKGIEAFTSGKIAYDIDQERLYEARTPVVFAIVLTLSFLFLLIAFRSVVIPLKAIILNVLSTGASFGLLVLFFQIGGFKFGVIESFVPALLFSILFGLSMDYHLLLISRINEEQKKGKETGEAVSIAIQETYGVISSAAVIMVSVFAVISMLELPLMKQLGIGLGFAVLIDATMVRCMLLPASMILLGDWNWYLPKWLEWLPDFGRSSKNQSK